MAYKRIVHASGNMTSSTVQSIGFMFSDACIVRLQVMHTKSSTILVCYLLSEDTCTLERSATIECECSVL